MRISKTLNYNVIFRPEPEGGFTVIVPALPGCITYGKDLVEAKHMAEDAIKGYLLVLRKDGEDAPTDTDSFIASIQIKEKSRKKVPAYA